MFYHSQIRNKLNEQQHSKLVVQKEALADKQKEMGVVDKRIEELTQRLHRKRQNNNQQQVQLRSNTNKNRPRPLSANVAAVEPFQHIPHETLADDMHPNLISMQTPFGRQDTKHMSLLGNQRHPNGDNKHEKDKAPTLTNGHSSVVQNQHSHSPTKGHATALAAMEATLKEAEKHTEQYLAAGKQTQLAGRGQAEGLSSPGSAEGRVSSPQHTLQPPDNRVGQLAPASPVMERRTSPTGTRVQPPAFMRPVKRDPITISVSKTSPSSQNKPAAPSPPTSVSSLSSTSSLSQEDRSGSSPNVTSKKNSDAEKLGTSSLEPGKPQEEPERDTSGKKDNEESQAQTNVAAASEAPTNTTDALPTKFQPRSVNSGRFVGRLGTGAMEQYRKNMTQLYQLPLAVPTTALNSTNSEVKSDGLTLSQSGVSSSPDTSISDAPSSETKDAQTVAHSVSKPQQVLPPGNSKTPKLLPSGEAPSQTKQTIFSRSRRIEIPSAFQARGGAGPLHGTDSGKVPKYNPPPRYPGAPNVHYPLIDSFIPNITKSVKKRHSFTEAIPGSTNLEGPTVVQPESIKEEVQEKQLADEINVNTELHEKDEDEEEVGFLRSY